MADEKKPGLHEGDSVFPIAQFATTGLHELTFLAAACCASPSLHARTTDGEYAEDIDAWADRTVKGAHALLTRKEYP